MVSSKQCNIDNNILFSLEILDSDLLPEEWAAFSTVSLVKMKIMVTPYMTQLLTDVCNADGEKHKLLVGPSKIGKSTLLLWLYIQLKKKGMLVKVFTYDDMNCKIDEAVKLIKDVEIILLDLHNFESSCNHHKFLQFLSVCINTRVVIASSGLYIAPDSRGGVQNSINKLKTLKHYVVPPLSCEDALTFCQLCHPSLSTDSMKQVIDQSGKYPGLIALASRLGGGLLEFQSQLYSYIQDEWMKVLRKIRAGMVDVQNYIKLLFATLYGQPIDLAKLQIAFVRQSILYQAYMITLNENNVPVVKLHGSIDAIQQLTSQLIPTDPKLVTDSESAIGGVFEFLCLEAFKMCEIKMVKLSKDSLTNAGTLKFSLLSKQRIEFPQDPTPNFLYHLIQKEPGADCAALTSNSYMLLVQITVIKKDHTRKLNSFVVLTDRKYINVHPNAANIIPKKIIYLYLNPCVEEHSSTMFQRANKVKADIISHHRAIFSTKEWFYAEACGNFATEIMRIYSDIKRILSPN